MQVRGAAPVAAGAPSLASTLPALARLRCRRCSGWRRMQLRLWRPQSGVVSQFPRIFGPDLRACPPYLRFQFGPLFRRRQSASRAGISGGPQSTKKWCHRENPPSRGTASRQLLWHRDTSLHTPGTLSRYMESDSIPEERSTLLSSPCFYVFRRRSLSERPGAVRCRLRPLPRTVPLPPAWLPLLPLLLFQRLLRRLCGPARCVASGSLHR
mmetsp:Transcript_11868/g.28754  ORF Transcript_11868/g.28754 Transcript_11868/m.28754 type:complete len:211 (+) Transcript_11868:4628-5260(+)